MTAFASGGDTSAKQKCPGCTNWQCGLDDRWSLPKACGNMCISLKHQSGAFSRTEQKYVSPAAVYRKSFTHLLDKSECVAKNNISLQSSKKML